MKPIRTIGLICGLAVCVAGLSQTASSEPSTEPRPQLPSLPPTPPAFDLLPDGLTEEITPQSLRAFNQEIRGEMQAGLTGPQLVQQQKRAVQTQLRENLTLHASDAVGALLAASRSNDELIEGETKALAANAAKP